MKKTGKRVLCLVLLCALLLPAAGAVADQWEQGSGGRWWYSRSDGSYVRYDWLWDNGSWYFFDDAGWMVTGWYRIGGSWYHFAPSGTMETGWVRDGAWYYLGNDGSMRTGWLQDGQKYYLEDSGKMAVGWRKIGSDWYYFKENGAMATGTVTIDGKKYTFDRNGRWIESAGLEVCSITLSRNTIGPFAYIQIANNLSVAVDRVDFTVYCYDAYGRQIKGYDYYTHDDDWYDGLILPGGKSPSDHYWSLYGYDGVRTIVVTITKYHTADGRTVSIPKDRQQSWHN